MSEKHERSDLQPVRVDLPPADRVGSSTENSNGFFDLMAFVGLFKLIVQFRLHAFKLTLFAIVLTFVDGMIIIFNLISPRRKPQHIVPPPFSPSSPPPFSRHPVVFILCKLAKAIGSKTSPEWLNEWSRWDGVDQNGKWPELDPRLSYAKVSRSPCPALNALANHGILPKSGKNLRFHEITSAVSRAYNLSPTLAIQLLAAANELFEDRGAIDLEQLCTHGLIEHDASLFRPDSHCASPGALSKPHIDLIERHLPRSKESITFLDLSERLRTRRKECSATNPQYRKTWWFRIFGSGNCAMIMEIFGGRKVDELRAWVGESGIERIPFEDWRPRADFGWGLTILRVQYSTLKIACRI